MLEIRRSAERGYSDHGWLKSFHTFSFADYYDPKWMGYGPLRVINDDRVAPGEGFGKHGHRDMEILTYILAGELEHEDSMGNGSVIWILPDALRMAPGYEQRHYPAADKRGRLRLIAAHDGEDGAVVIHQDARIYAGLFDGAERAEFRVAEGRRAWLQVARGALSAGDVRLSAGDAARTAGAADLILRAGADAEVLLFDLP